MDDGNMMQEHDLHTSYTTKYVTAEPEEVEKTAPKWKDMEELYIVQLREDALSFY